MAFRDWTKFIGLRLATVAFLGQKTRTGEAPALAGSPFSFNSPNRQACRRLIHE